MFKKLFSKEKSKPDSKPSTIPSGSQGVAGTGAAQQAQMEDPSSWGAEQDKGKAFWRNLNIHKGIKTFRRLKDVYNQLPQHFMERIRLIDYCLGTTSTETHKLLTLIFYELYGQNEDHALFLESSPEWEEWYSGFDKLCTNFRRSVKEKIHQLVSGLNYEEKNVDRLNTIVESKPGTFEQLTGLDKIEDIKSNMIDIAVILGKESESKIVQNVVDEPVRVAFYFTASEHH